MIALGGRPSSGSGRAASDERIDKRFEGAMNWIEIIQLRSYSSRHRDNALEAFAHLSPPPRIVNFKGISLFRNRLLENDLCISIPWHGPHAGTA